MGDLASALVFHSLSLTVRQQAGRLACKDVQLYIEILFSGTQPSLD